MAPPNQAADDHVGDELRMTWGTKTHGSPNIQNSNKLGADRPSNQRYRDRSLSASGIVKRDHGQEKASANRKNGSGHEGVSSTLEPRDNGSTDDLQLPTSSPEHGAHASQDLSEQEVLGAESYFHLRDALEGPKPDDPARTDGARRGDTSPTIDLPQKLYNGIRDSKKTVKLKIPPSRHTHEPQEDNDQNSKSSPTVWYENAGSIEMEVMPVNAEFPDNKLPPNQMVWLLVPLTPDEMVVYSKMSSAEPIRRSVSTSDISSPGKSERKRKFWVNLKGEPASYAVTFNPDNEKFQLYGLQNRGKDVAAPIRHRKGSLGHVSSPMLEIVKAKLKVWSWRKGVGQDSDAVQQPPSPTSENLDCEPDEGSVIRSPDPGIPPVPPNTARQSEPSSRKQSHLHTPVSEDDFEDTDDDDDDDDSGDDEPVELHFKPVLRHLMDAHGNASFRRRSLTAPLGITHRLSNLAEEDSHFQSHRDSVQLLKNRKQAQGLEGLLAEQLMNAKDSFLLNKSRFGAKGKRTKTVAPTEPSRVEYTDPTREASQMRSFRWPGSTGKQQER